MAEVLIDANILVYARQPAEKAKYGLAPGLEAGAALTAVPAHGVMMNPRPWPM